MSPILLPRCGFEEVVRMYLSVGASMIKAGFGAQFAEVAQAEPA